MQILGYKPDLSYNIALCHYQQKHYAPALKHIADIIEKGIREHPGLLLFTNFYVLTAVFWFHSLISCATFSSITAISICYHVIFRFLV